MTQAMNLANFANSLDSSGGVPPSQLNAPVTIAKGGTNASTASAARANLGLVIGTDIPAPTGTGASGTWVQSQAARRRLRSVRKSDHDCASSHNHCSDA